MKKMDREPDTDNKHLAMSNQAFLNLPVFQSALEASRALPEKERSFKTESFLEERIRLAGELALFHLPLEKDPENWHRKEFPDQPKALADWRKEKLDKINKNNEILKKVRKADQVLPRQLEINAKIKSEEVILGKESHQKAIRLQESYLSSNLFESAWLVNSYDNPEVGEVVDKMAIYLNANTQTYGHAANNIFLGQGSEEEYQFFNSFIENLVYHGDRFCQAAAAGVNDKDNPELWRHCMSTARAIEEYTSFALTSIGSAYKPRDPDEWLPPELRKNRSGDAERASEPAKPAGNSKKKSRSKPAKGKAASSSNPPQDSKSDYRNMLTKEIDKQFKKWQTPPGAGDDPIAVARAMDKDIGKVDNLQGEPSSVYKQKSFQTDKWFGNLNQLKDMKQKLHDLPAPDEPKRLAELDRCINRRERMEKVLLRQQVDGFKTYGYPRAIHLKHLLEAGEVDRTGVSAPVRLPSEGDVGHKGTLFEVRIQPKPLSNGQPSPSLYLHLHTDQPVSARDLEKIEPNRFTAIHLKNDTQRRLGRQWEELTGQLGEVHRGKVGGELARKLLTMAR